MRLSGSLVLCVVFFTACCVTGRKISLEEQELLFAEKGYGMLNEYVEPKIVAHTLSFFGLAETGYDNKVLTLNSKGEFSYIDLSNPDHPRLEVITPGFPGVVGVLGADAEHHVAWVVRGRGVYFIDLESKKTGHMIAGNDGKVTQVLLADKDRLLFSVVVFSVEASILYTYELSINKDYGRTGLTANSVYINLNSDTLLFEKNQQKSPKYTGWYLTNTFFTNFNAVEPGSILPGSHPLTKALMKNNAHAVNEIGDKMVHQGKCLMFVQFKPVKDSASQYSLVQWSDDLQDIQFNPLVLQFPRPTRQAYYGPIYISADGNWVKFIRYHPETQPKMEELVVYHIQDIYPQGISMPVSLGYTNTDPGAFMTHSEFGPCYVEQSTMRGGIMFIFKLNDAIDILKKQALDKAQGSVDTTI